MENRKKIIEDIMANFQAMRNKMQARFMQSGRDNPVTYSQWFVLAIIDRKNNIGIKEISEMLGVSSSAATQLVDGLVDNGYVLRNADPKDRRALQLKMSVKGKKYIVVKTKEHAKKMMKMFEVLSDGELATYLKIQKKLFSNVPGKNVL